RAIGAGLAGLGAHAAGPLEADAAGAIGVSAGICMGDAPVGGASHHAPPADRQPAGDPDDFPAARPVWLTPGRDRLMPLLELTNIDKHFGGLQVVHDLCLAVEPGEIVSLIGPNGAGKTTAFNLITGLYAPDAGDIRFNG